MRAWVLCELLKQKMILMKVTRFKCVLKREQFAIAESLVWREHSTHRTTRKNIQKERELELKLEFEWSRQASGIEAVLIC